MARGLLQMQTLRAHRRATAMLTLIKMKTTIWKLGSAAEDAAIVVVGGGGADGGGGGGGGGFSG